jgi:uncharacterized protein
MRLSASPHKSVAKIEDFVAPFYVGKDMMHDLSHIRRLLRSARSLSRKHPANGRILTYAAYFHGIDLKKHEAALAGFLKSQGLQKKEIDRTLAAARESKKESRPKTVEGMILHDAHLTEGGSTFLAVKSLVAGLQRGSSLAEIIHYFEKHIDGRFRCYLPENRKIYSEREGFARHFFSDLKKNL